MSMPAPEKSVWTAIRQSAPVRKSWGLALQAPRAIRRARSSAEDYSQRPIVLANSFPKSGTHLLLQIVEALPGVRSYGSFLASMPSLTQRERSAAEHLRRIRRMVPGELVPAHLMHDPRYAAELAGRNCVHFFIYRDLRDVAVSEAHYLTYMNRWHRLHRYFRALPNDEERIAFAIRGATDPGFPVDYPGIGERFRRYERWLLEPSVLALRYEDLRSTRLDSTVKGMVQHFLARCGDRRDADEITARAVAGIDPARSHTFRAGRARGWERAFTPRLAELMKESAGDVLVRLGYETDLAWGAR
jgi:sulfotransferase 6B1